jgi:hypothetical protein
VFGGTAAGSVLSLNSTFNASTSGDRIDLKVGDSGAPLTPLSLSHSGTEPLSTFTGNLQNGSKTFSQLSTPANGQQVYCSDCKVTSATDNTCTSGGSGSMAFRANSTWQCAGTGSGGIMTCEGGIGDGLNAIASGTYLQTNCVNKTGATITINSIECNTDNSGSSTLNATNGAGTALLTGAVTCTSAIPGAAGTQSGTTTLASNDGIKFSFVADGTSKQTLWTVKFTR